MNLTKAETLEQLKNKVSYFEVPDFFYFTVKEFYDDKEKVIDAVKSTFSSDVVIRSSSIYEDGEISSSAGEFESVLNINPLNKHEVLNSIEKVIKSYSHKESADNQIIIQNMLKNTSMSGVVFTHDMNTGAPYYVINYDDESGVTDTVTSGTSEYSNRTLYIHRGAIDKLHSERFKKLLRAIEELENILDSKFLDIEFALSKRLEPYLLQVRPITTTPSWDNKLNNRINLALKNVDSFIQEKLKRIQGVYGETSVFGQMPDWNPVEMIGRAPRALAASLYRLIITDDAWRIAREQMGYAVPPGQPLMKMLAGQPYIDTRLSFHSYLPEDISSSIAEKLVDHWVSSLAASPELHDKIEFDVAITTYSFDFNQKINDLVGDVLNSNEKEEFKNSHLNLARKLIRGDSIGSIEKAIDKLDSLKNKQDNNIKKYNISSLSEMVNDCISLGTVPFSILARHGFIAKTILLSLKEKGIFTLDEINQIQAGVYTIASELVDDMHSLNSKKITIDNFMKKYGHLRPGTYDIMSQRYDQMNSFSAGNNTLKTTSDRLDMKAFNFSEKQETEINQLLKKDGFGDFDAHDLLKYVQEAIEGREYGKFIFTKTLSDILELIAHFAESINLDRETISHIPVDEIIDLSKNTIETTISKYLTEVSRSEIEKHKVCNAIRLPQLLTDNLGVYVIPFQVSQPNFITNKKIISDTLFLDRGDESADMNNKIIVIEGADPGFDWIFSQKIAGLVTKYGGANSHMAIRCAEFGIPAAIGCGEQRYDIIKKAKQAHLDCAAGLLLAIH